MNTLGQRIKFLREKANMSQHEVSKFTGISRSNVGKIENDKIVPNCDAIVEISKLFKVSTDFLLLGKIEVHRTKNVQVVNSDTSQLTEEEKDLILKFRHFDELDKELVVTTIDNLMKRLEKNSASYSYVLEDEDVAAVAEESAEYNVKKHA